MEKSKKKEVAVIGQGYIGVPMAVLIAHNTNFIVNGIDKNNIQGNKIKEKLEKNLLPFKTKDQELLKKFKKVKKLNKYRIYLNLDSIKRCKTIIVSVGFDFTKKNSIKNLKKLFFDISNKIEKKTLLILETTLPPGTSEKIIIPLLKKNLNKRNININDIYFAYSYERVTPGSKYYDSIFNNYRVYAGFNSLSSKVCQNFLKKIINTKKYPLTKLENIKDCETCKIFENTYRAVNIALLDEFTKFSIENKIDIKKILTAIRLRKTHNNIMNPGLGVGGYCLTKDPKFLSFSSKYILKSNLKFPIIDRSMSINSKMVNTSISFIKKKIKTFKNKKILQIGISYKEDVDDIRFSPSAELAFKLKKMGAILEIYDTLFTPNDKMPLNFVDELNFKRYDYVLFCVGHKKIKNINLKKLDKKPIYFDLNNIFKKVDYLYFKRKKIKFFELSKPI